MLFDSIGDGKDILTKEEVQAFLEDVKPFIRPEALDEIEAKAEGECLNREYFKKWLVLATRFDSQRNSKMAKYYGMLGEQSGAVHKEPKVRSCHCHCHCHSSVIRPLSPLLYSNSSLRSTARPELEREHNGAEFEEDAVCRPGAGRHEGGDAHGGGQGNYLHQHR